MGNSNNVMAGAALGEDPPNETGVTVMFAEGVMKTPLLSDQSLLGGKVGGWVP